MARCIGSMKAGRAAPRRMRAQRCRESRVDRKAERIGTELARRVQRRTRQEDLMEQAAWISGWVSRARTSFAVRAHGGRESSRSRRLLRHPSRSTRAVRGDPTRRAMRSPVHATHRGSRLRGTSRGWLARVVARARASMSVPARLKPTAARAVEWTTDRVSRRLPRRLQGQLQWPLRGVRGHGCVCRVL